MGILITTPPPENTCKRCGACCLKGGPALHQDDAALFLGPDALDLCLVLTLRAGEPAFDQVQGRVAPLERELLKLRGTGDTWACALYDARAKACGLYDRRPAECRALNCRDTSALAAMYDKARLSRADLLPKGHPVLGVMAEHETLVPAHRVAPLAAELRDGGPGAESAHEELTRMALADQAFRRALAQKAGIDENYHDFFLGRGAHALFTAAGLVLREDARLGLRVQPDPLWRG